MIAAIILLAALSDGCGPQLDDATSALVVSINALPEPGLREELRRAMREPHDTPITYSEARKKIFQMHMGDDGRVWDVYGQRRARSSGLPAVEDINIEHTWPQSRFDRGWKGLSKNKDDRIKADMHNLFPTDNKLNADRGHDPFVDLGCAPDRSCDGGDTFEVPDVHKGNVARAMFYFAVRYAHEIPPSLERTMREWHLADPPDDHERWRNGAIEEIQGNRNLFIDDPSLVDRIRDF